MAYDGDDPTPAGGEDVTLPEHLVHMGGWVEIPGFGWLREWHREGVLDLMWWHDCPAMRDQPGWSSVRHIDVSSGERHTITGGSLADGDLTIHGGSGSIPCDKCGLHGWVRGGKWVTA
jgi:hypothetical protein